MAVQSPQQQNQMQIKIKKHVVKSQTRNTTRQTPDTIMNVTPSQGNQHPHTDWSSKQQSDRGGNSFRPAEPSNYNDASSLESYQMLSSFNNLDMPDYKNSRTTTHSNYNNKNKPGTSVSPNVDYKKQNPTQDQVFSSYRKDTDLSD